MDSSAQITSDFKKRGRLVYWLAVLALCVTTTLGVIFYYQEGLAFILYILSCFSIGGGVYAWCYFDGKQRGYQFTPSMRTALGLFGPITVPVYFVKTRGFKAAAKTGFGLSLYIPFYALYYTVWEITGFILKAIGYYS